MQKIKLFTIIFLILGCLSVNVLEACWETPKLLPSVHSLGGDNAGAAIDMDGNTVVVGGWSYGYGTPVGQFRGIATVFVNVDGAWTEQATLEPDDYARFFGGSVALDDNTVVVGSPGTNAAYVFVRNGFEWFQQAKLVGNDTHEGDEFGKSVSIDNDTLVIGAPNAGSAYVFVRDGNSWTQQSKLLQSDSTNDDRFGENLQMSGDLILVSAHHNNIQADNRSNGAVYVYERTGNTWNEQAKLSVSEARGFGAKISLDNNSVLVLSWIQGSVNWVAYVFEYDSGMWSNQAVLTANELAWDNSISLSGDTAIIGSQRNNVAHVFRRVGQNWQYSVKLAPDDAGGDTNYPDKFGYAVYTDSSNAFIGAPYDDDNGSDNGSVYVMNIPSNFTPEGQNVSVYPLVVDEYGNPIEGAPKVAFLFEEVTQTGDTSVTITSLSSETALAPTGYRVIGKDDIPILFDLSTSAITSPDSMFEVCIDYSSMGVAGDPSKLKLAHKQEHGWTDITSVVDTANKNIFGIEYDFSFFAIVESADPLELLQDLIDAVSDLNANHGIINSLDAKLEAAEKALTDAKDNNDGAAINVLMYAFIDATEAQSGKHIPELEANELILRALEIVAVIDGTATI